MLAIFPEILHATEKGDLESLACLIRRYFAESDQYAPKLSLEKLLSKAGVELVRDSIAGIASMLVVEYRGGWILNITLNARCRDPREVNITLATLFGHYLLAWQRGLFQGELTQSSLHLEQLPWQAFQQDKRKRVEHQQALAFASALLMPLGMVKKAYSALGSVEETAQFFGVHPLLLEQRLLTLGLVSKSMPASVAVDPAPPIKPASVERQPATARPQQSSLVKAQKSVASFQYRKGGELPKETAQETTGEKPKNSEKKPEKPLKGMQKLRAIAQKIDGDVEL